MPQHYHNKKKKYHKKQHESSDNNHDVVSSSKSSSVSERSSTCEDSTPVDHGDTNSNIISSMTNMTLASNPINSSKLYELQKSEILGRYIVTAKDLKAGDIVIREQPIVIGPCADSEPICLGCYLPLLMVRQKQYKCPGCGWPLCGPKCKGIKCANGHSTYECSTLREKRVADLLDRYKGSDLSQMYEAIVPLRCLLLKSYDKRKWEKLQTMEHHNDIRKGLTTLWNRNQKVIVNQLRNIWGFKEFSEEEIHTVCGYLEVNCFEIGQNSCRARALYDNAYLLSHDCSPNTTHSDNPDTYEMVIRVTRNMIKSEPITLSYAYTLQGTLKRRQHLQEGKFFWCQCNRCTDPTELGTYSSAVQCPKCNGNGIILSTNPLNQTAPWTCQTCKYTVTGQSMLLLADKVFNELDAINAQNIQKYEEFLEKYKNVFHKNHYLCVCAKHSLCQLYGRSDGFLIQELTIEQMKNKEEYCRDVLAVVDKLEPGLSRLRGSIMYELHAPIMIQATRMFEARKINSDGLKQRLREVIKLLKDCEEILALEPEGSSEHTMAMAAHDAIKRIGKV